MKHRLTLSALLLGLVVAPLAAQSVEPGVHAGLSIPSGDLSTTLDGRMGYTLGAHMGLYYGGGHELRPRLDLTRFQGGWHPVGDGHFERSRVSGWSLGADYLYHIDRRASGVYLLMGLGQTWWSCQNDGRPDENTSALGVSMGAGYRADRNWFFEGRFTTSSFRDTNGQAYQVQGILGYRF